MIYALTLNLKASLTLVEVLALRSDVQSYKGFLEQRRSVIAERLNSFLGTKI